MKNLVWNWVKLTFFLLIVKDNKLTLYAWANNNLNYELKILVNIITT